MNSEKEKVKDFWNNASCGEELYLKDFTMNDYQFQADKRYELEPIKEFAEFKFFKNLKTLEIGVGLGADHQQLAENGAILTGVDLTERAIGHTKRRFELFGLHSILSVADAENLPFENESFEAVYSYGVLHHTPNTQKAFDEVYRVLKPGGMAKVLIYNKYSLIGLMLWLRYALFSFKPWRSLNFIYSNYLESPGTKAYSYKEAKILLSKFENIIISTPLGHADLLTSNVGQRHRGIFLNIAKRLWPRWFFKTFFPSYGLGMMISFSKPKIQ